MADDAVEALRAENRRLRAAVKHLQDELANAQERIAFLSQELARVRTKLPPGPVRPVCVLLSIRRFSMSE